MPIDADADFLSPPPLALATALAEIPASPESTMLPGTYLRKRREAAGLQLDGLVCAIACAVGRIRIVTGVDLPLIEARVLAAERNEMPLPLEQAQILHPIFAFDLGVYEALLLRLSDPAIPVPTVCRDCACSWHDACVTDDGPCAWAEPGLCTACETRAARDAALAAALDWPDAPQPEGSRP